MHAQTAEITPMGTGGTRPGWQWKSSVVRPWATEGALAALPRALLRRLGLELSPLLGQAILPNEVDEELSRVA